MPRLHAPAGGASALARIRDHLTEKSIDALVEIIVDLAERDSALFRRLDMAAATVHADDKTLEARLRKAIDLVTRTRGFVDYRGAAGWAEGVDAALDALADLASGGRAGLALNLVERAIDRIERAVEEIDDSDGHCCIAPATSISPQPVRRYPIRLRSLATFSPARQRAITGRSTAS